MKTFKLTFEDEDVNIDVEEDEFSFKDFDALVRTRFAIALKDGVTYLDNNGTDVLMSKSFVKRNNNVKIKLIKYIHKVVSSPTTVVSVVDTFLVYVYIAVPLSIAAACIYPTAGTHIPLIHYCNLFDDYLILMNVIPKAGVTLEACVAFVCWATTYLFVRRLLNPENDGYVAIRKFAPDSFFGGIAAGISVILKAYLLMHMVANNT